MARRVVDTLAAVGDSECVVSLEFFPPHTEDGRLNLLRRIEDLGVRLRPAFVTLTWRAEMGAEDEWLQIGSMVQREFGIDVLLHLTCHLPVAALRGVLARMREAGIRNVLALRGDPVSGAGGRWRPAEGGFSYASELVRLIREEHGDYFCIGVAGYPEVHTECWNSPDLPPSVQARERDLQRLKAKVDAGADFVLTQFVYSPQLFVDFVERCRGAGITVPVVPGYMPVQTYSSFQRFSSWCKTFVPAELRTRLELVRDDDAAVKDAGVELAVAAVRELRAAGSRCVHLYTMNMGDSVTAICEALELVPKRHQRELPWGASAQGGSGRARGAEEIRPIFWAHRQTSYLSRTTNWTEFPNGRWGDARSPAYGELTSYYLGHKRPTGDRRELWGVPQTLDDITRVFVGYLQGSVPELPWCDTPLLGESSAIADDLCWLNESGFFTINSQPRANCVPSTDPDVGWGGPGGFVFQKAYVEFFCSPERLAKLRARFADHPTLVYHAIAADGREETNNPDSGGNGGAESVNAVTWGVFPGREIVQPTIVDAASFAVWKDEAFELWLSRWASAYDDPEDPADAAAVRLIREIHDTYFLVNVVDNDYMSPDADVFRIFRAAIADGMGEPALRARVAALESDRAALSAQVTRLRQLQGEAAQEIERKQRELAQARAEADELRARVREMQVSLA